MRVRATARQQGRHTSADWLFLIWTQMVPGYSWDPSLLAAGANVLVVNVSPAFPPHIVCHRVPCAWTLSHRPDDVVSCFELLWVLFWSVSRSPPSSGRQWRCVHADAPDSHLRPDCSCSSAALWPHPPARLFVPPTVLSHHRSYLCFLAVDFVSFPPLVHYFLLTLQFLIEVSVFSCCLFGPSVLP